MAGSAVGRLFNTIGKLGIGLAIAGGVANSALYNGKQILLIKIKNEFWSL